MSDELQIQVEEQPDVMIVRMKGEAGISSSGKLEFELTRLCARKPNFMIIDLSGVSMIASLAMGQLIAVQRAIVRDGGKVRFAAVQPMVLDSFKHARLDKVFQCFPTIADAMTAT